MSESLREKLRRLRRDEPCPDTSSDRAQRPPDVRDRLSRRASRTVASAPRPAPPVTDAHRSGPPERLEALEHEGARLFARRTHVAVDARHGAFRLDDVRHADSEAFELLARDAALADLDLTRTVFLDTETSGLAGGSGTWVFMVGLGTFTADGTGDGFEVWQGFLADPADERALLAETADRVRASGGVVSFFGKSFDRHRLEDRMRQHGIAPPFEERPHLDLYHPLRRLYGRALDDVRLRTVERELIAFEREDDLPGAFAPEAWFDFLADRPHRLEGVFEHNLHDVLSLVALAAHLGRCLTEERADGRSLDGPAGARAHAIARTLFESGRREEALAWIATARERAPSRALALLEADALRLTGAWERAWMAYRAIAHQANDVHTARAWCELAKLAEHRRHDVVEALACCERAEALRLELPFAEARRLERELGRRVERLRKKHPYDGDGATGP